MTLKNKTNSILQAVALFLRGRAFTALSLDILRCLLLAIFVSLAWCYVTGRWTSEMWQLPLEYTNDHERADITSLYAGVKAASQGHFIPFLFKTIPELGAPAVAQWNDYPIVEQFLLFFTGILANYIGIFPAVTFAVMFAHILASISFYVACRLFQLRWLWAFAGAVIFGLSSFGFAHGAHHLNITYYWHVPLCLIVCYWINSEQGLTIGSRRFIFALGVAFVTGLQNVYYTNIFVQLVLLGGFIQAVRTGWRGILPAFGIVAMAALAFSLMNIHTWIFQLIYGPPDKASFVRLYQHLELYALKCVDLVIPPPDHRSAAFAAFGSRHLQEIVLPPGEFPPPGYIGIVGIAGLFALLLTSFQAVVKRSFSIFPIEAWQILWIFIYSTTGGLNAIIGSTLGMQLFRTTSRYSIVILCIILFYLVKTLTKHVKKMTFLSYALVTFVTCVALWDQLPQSISEQHINETEFAVTSDREFTNRMESALPKAAMVFQLPIMEFPEGPVPGVPSWDHFRPYIFSKFLRYSFGAMKGRPEARWQKDLTALTLDAAVAKLRAMGFRAILINRNGFPDKAKGFLQSLSTLGQSQVIESPAGDLVCVILPPV